MRSRFEWGLLTDVQAPDLETRIAILRKKAQMDKIDVPDDVLRLVASHIERNIRELEGALIRVTAFASLTSAELNRSLAEVVLRNLLPETGIQEVSAPRIIAVITDYFGVSVDQLKGPSRKADVVLPRQIAMYLCRELTEQSLPSIGNSFGRNHATVLHAHRTVGTKMKKDAGLRQTILSLQQRLGGVAAPS